MKLRPLKNLKFREVAINSVIAFLIFSCLAAVFGIGLYIGVNADLGLGDPALHEHFWQNSEDVLQITVSQLTDVGIMVGYVFTLLLCWSIYLFTETRKKSRKLHIAAQLLAKESETQKRSQRALDVRDSALKKRADLVNRIVDGTPDFINAIDLNYNIIFCNDSYKKESERLFGIDFVEGANALEFQKSQPQVMEQSKMHWNRALAGEKFTSFEEFESNQGILHYEATYGPIRDENNEIIGASNIVRDVTKRIEAESILKREHDFINYVIETSNLLVLNLDLEGRIIGFNKACEIASGYKFAEVRGRIYWNILIPADEAPEVKSIYRKYEDFDVPRNSVGHWVTKSELRRLVSWRIALISDGQGGRQILATGIDITEKEEFREMQSRVLEILESSSDYISIANLMGELQYLNPFAQEVLGLKSPEEVSTTMLGEAFSETALEKIQSVGIPTALKRGSWMGETTIRTSRGREFPVSQLILAHKNERGDVEFISTVARDISRQKMLENEYQSARDAALETARVKSEFLANMSHEIRTPMNGIIGISELLMSTELSPEQQDYVISIQRSGEILLAIVNDILDFSKMEAGKLYIENVSFQLRGLVESILDLFVEPARRKKIEIGLYVHNDVPDNLHGDPRRLRQVLTNLIANAVKFTEHGEIIVKVGLDSQADESGTLKLRFDVNDTGIGIPENVQTSLFDPFTQADNSIQRKYGGTGLGLAISKQIVEIMDGEIGVESSVNEGANFWFTAGFQSQESGKYSDYYIDELRNLRVLFAAANDTTRNMMLQQAKWVGILADEVSSAEIAVRRLSEALKNNEPFDVIVIDEKLTDKAGLEFAEEFKADKRFRKTKTLFISSVNEHRKMIRARKFGIDSYIFKPIKISDLYSALADLSTVTKDGLAYPKGEITKVEFNNKLGIIEEDFPVNGDKTSINILVAEDNLLNQKVISNQIANLGYSVDIVSNGEEALEILKFKDYSLILMDCEMPVMDGLQATMEIRKRTKGNDLPIIAITAHALEGDREKCLSAGMDDYITKPTKQAELGNLIHRWLMRFKTSEPATIHHLDFVDDKEERSIYNRIGELADDCGSDVAMDCIDLFKNDVAKSIVRLQSAIETLNMEAIEHEAHKLKGGTSNMGATRLPELCSEIMISARNNHTDVITMLFTEFQHEFEHVVPVLEEIYTNFANETAKLQPIK
ncbi:MAG: response regulator [Pyrinomonadaceae bacterium]